MTDTDTFGNDMIKFDGLDGALLGIGTFWEGQLRRALFVYSGETIIEILMEEHGMEEEDALEYLSNNIECIYGGPGTPMVVWTPTPEEQKEYGLPSYD